MKALPQPGSGCSAQLAGVAAGLPGFADTTQNLPNYIDREMENSLNPTFSSFPPSKTGGCSTLPPQAIHSPVVQTCCIFLPKFANRAKSDHLRNPTAGLGCGVVCTTFGFAQKTDAKPVGGRGISAFSAGFFLAGRFSLTYRDSRPYPLTVAANSATGLGNPISKGATAPPSRLQALFLCLQFCVMAAVRGRSSGLPGSFTPVYQPVHSCHPFAW